MSRFEQFTICISSIYQYIQKIERDEMERFGLKGAYAQYLLAISRCPDGVTVTQLCDLCEKDKAAVSRAINEMEHQGNIIRALNKDCSYRAKITLTEKGRLAAEYVQQKADAAVEQAGKGLREEDRKIFYATLDLISNNLQIICKNGISDELGRKSE